MHTILSRGRHRINAISLNSCILPIDILAVQTHPIELGPESSVVYPFTRSVKGLPLSSDG